MTDTNQTAEKGSGVSRLLPYLLVGIYFGIIFTKSEVISWYRIQEMFRFQSFHMYGIIGSAVLVSIISIQVIKRYGLKTLDGSNIEIPPKEMGGGTRYWAGGTVFGLGWALTGACPGPLFALIGSGAMIMLVTILAAVAGTYAYGVLRPRLPH